ncbi:hypothetical protein E8E11_004078 [Didymella keratinophila]|nr:hypothetical protein E8E11_004078 [Didymella keratinophila]
MAEESFSTCYYDCQNPPKHATPSPDITGIGISLAYTLTAGFSVFINLTYYLLAYRPNGASVGKQDAEHSSDLCSRRANPIDE